MNFLRSVMLATALVAPGIAWAQAPDYYPGNYGDIVKAAQAEGKVIVYSPLDASAARALVEDFESIYPGVAVEYNDLSTSVLHNRFISEVAAGASTADIVWSSAMDLQMHLVKDGYALAYESPEKAKLPTWSVYENQAYGTTFEPIVFVYNKAELTPEEVPQTHADLAKLFKEKADVLEGRVTSYDIENSGIGFLTVAVDSRQSEAFWDIPKALGSVHTKFVSGSGQMIDSVASGENVFAYNQIGSYARRVADNPDVGVIMPSDYTLVMSRVAFIPAKAPHPNAGKLWLDYLLSQRGQTIVMNQAGLYSLRSDVDGEFSAATLTKQLGTALKPIPISPEILETLDKTFISEFLAKWKAAVRG
jgi:iron(III) transport system substrate-binding protein